MRYIVNWEFCLEDVEKVIEKNMNAAKIREKEPNRFPTYLYPPQYVGPGKGFSLVEVSDPVQFNNSNVYWFPELRLKFTPCDDVSKWIELYKSK